jgi:hypothetical protein
VTLSDSDKGRPVVKVIEDAIYVILHANIVPYRAAAEHVLAELRRLPVEQRAEAVGLVARLIDGQWFFREPFPGERADG